MEVKKEGSKATIILDVDSLSADFTVIDKEIDALIEAHIRKIILDMRNVEYVNSTSIEILIRNLKHCREMESHLALQNLVPKVKQIFSLLKMDKPFDIFDAEADQDSMILREDAGLSITTEVKNTLGIIHLKGVFNFEVGRENFCKAWGELLKSVSKIAIDCKGLEYLDSFALAEIINLHKVTRAKKGIVYLSGANSVVLAVMNLLSLDQLITIKPELSDVLSAEKA